MINHNQIILPTPSKVVRMKEVRREKAAITFIKKNFPQAKDMSTIPVSSSWGPYQVRVRGRGRGRGRGRDRVKL